MAGMRAKGVGCCHPGTCCRDPSCSLLRDRGSLDTGDKPRYDKATTRRRLRGCGRRAWFDVIPALVAGIHHAACSEIADGWIPGTSPGMTRLVASGDGRAVVIPARVAGIHHAACSEIADHWIPVTSPGMTRLRRVGDGGDAGEGRGLLSSRHLLPGSIMQFAPRSRIAGYRGQAPV